MNVRSRLSAVLKPYPFSDPPHQEQDDQYQDNQPKPSAGCISPTSAVTPSGKCADKSENEYDKNDGAHEFEGMVLV